jgi:anti-sigma factor RsiW
MTARKLTCREFVEVLMAWLDDELEPARRGAFDAHLDSCVDCERYLDSYRTTVALGKSICGDDLDGPVPEDVPEDLVQAVLAARDRG